MTLTDIAAFTQELTTRAGDKVVRTKLGESGLGRTIDLLSIGEGRKSVLLVGTPHANEPLGCVTIARLLERFASDHDFLVKTGARWNFVFSIDPDGLAMNEAWLKGRRSYDDYIAGFFRPAFRRQPEFSFPYGSSRQNPGIATAENRCWQTALALTKPHLQCSLHNSEAGGVYHVVSHGLAPMSERLSELPSYLGLPVNSVGDLAGGQSASLTPGVFKHEPAMNQSIDLVSGSEAYTSTWDAGWSSADYAGRHYGTHSLICEVPMWEDLRPGRGQTERRSDAELARARRTSSQNCLTLLSRMLPLFEEFCRSPEDFALFHALDDYPRLLGVLLESPLLVPEAETQLTVSEYFAADNIYRCVEIRPVAMMNRLCSSLLSITSDTKLLLARSEIKAMLEGLVVDWGVRTHFRPYPIAQIAAMQTNAILAATAFLDASETGKRDTPW